MKGVVSDRPATQDTTYLVGRFLSGLGVLASIILLIQIAWELYTGVSYHRVHRGVPWGSGMSVLAKDPARFWSDVATQGVLVIFFVGWAIYARRIGRDDPEVPKA